MKITVFAKERKGKDNNTFVSYLSKLTKNTGEEVTVQIKFSDECGRIKKENCPCIIEAEPCDCSYSERKLLKMTRKLLIVYCGLISTTRQTKYLLTLLRTFFCRR